MSTQLMVYLQYMANWADADDKSINDLFDEYHYFLLIDDFDSDGAVDDEFTTLVDLATAVGEATIAADVHRIAADAAAIAAVWSFGLSMAAFAVAQADALIENNVASSKATELHEKLGTVDTDISGKIGGNVDNYVRSFKANNDMLKAKYTTGVDGAHARAVLLRFIATMVARGATLDPDTFRRYAKSARDVLKDEASINRVYDALDAVNLAGKDATDAELQEVIDSLKNMRTMGAPEQVMSMIKMVVFTILIAEIHVVNTRIKAFAEEAGVSVEELEVGTMDAMSAVEKFGVAVGFLVSALDVMFSILDIINVVNQTKQMVDKLNDPIKQQYKDFFNGIKHAAKEYKKAIQNQRKTTTTATTTTTSASA